MSFTPGMGSPILFTSLTSLAQHIFSTRIRDCFTPVVTSFGGGARRLPPCAPRCLRAAGEGGGADGDETLQRRAGWSGAATATMHEQWTRLHRPDKYGIDLEVDPYMEYDPEDPPPETAAFLKTLPEVWGKGEGAEVRVYFFYFLKCYV